MHYKKRKPSRRKWRRVGGYASEGKNMIEKAIKKEFKDEKYLLLK